MQQLSDEQWAQYQKDGYLVLGKLLDDAALKALQDRINAIMMGTADIDYSRTLMQLDSSSGAYDDAPQQSKGHKGATLDYRKIQDLEYDPVFLDYLQWPIFEDICRRAYGDADVACFRAMFMNKPSRKGTFLPWHQDRWANLDRDPEITIWTALDPATVENGCVQVIPGSHHKLLNPDHHSGFLTDEMAAEYCKEEDRVFVELEPGEVVLLHNYLLHGSDINRSDVSRRAFSVCYMDAATESKQDYPVVFGKGALDPQTVGSSTANV